MSLECEKREAEWSNAAVLHSVKSFAKLIGNYSGTVGGLVINGDLTAFGHANELSRFRELWTDNQQLRTLMPIYPGLGNHDYQNNIGDCVANLCADRMLSWFKGYVEDNLRDKRLSFDYQQELKYFLLAKHRGSLAYSWRQQLSDGDSIVFIQLNNFPTYTVSFKAKFIAEWNVTSSLSWLASHLSTLSPGQNVLLNLHDFDTKFTLEYQQQLKSVLEGFRLRYVAIVFAHFHSAVGLKYHWCINGQSTPLLYSGSVPGNNFALMQLRSGRQPSLKNFYSCHVNSLSTTSVSLVDLNLTPC